MANHVDNRGRPGRSALGKFFTDPIWWVYLFWMPDFLSRNLKLDLKGMTLPLFVIYSGACVGSIGGGWLSSSLLKRGLERECEPEDGDAGVRAGGDADHAGCPHRQCLVCGILVALAAGAHQGWSANIYTLASDMFPRGAVAPS